MDDKSLRQDVIDELDWSPGVDAAHIGVAVTNGVVTLTGHVPTYAQKIKAERTAGRVKGVKAIAQEMDVRFDGDGRTDEDIAAEAVSVLKWDVVLPANAPKVKVSKGWITLSGEVDWDYQRRAAEADVRNLRGVIGIINGVTIKPRVSPADVSGKIRQALQRDAALEASGVQVFVDNGKVTLEGKVHSWHERDAVERAAWAAPGVKDVVDHVRIG